MAALERMIQGLREEREDSERKLILREKVISSLFDDIQAEVEKSKEVIRIAYDTNRKLERALEVANTTIKNYEEITLPGLIASHQVFIQRWEAEAAVLEMKKVALSSKEAET